MQADIKNDKKSGLPGTPSPRDVSDCFVLIVDDDAISREILLSMLSEHCHCDTLASGSTVLEYCAEKLPDLIILDMEMPTISGIEVCKLLKGDRRFNAIPVIFVTANTDTQTQDACWEAGASDFVSKPVTPSTLRHRVRSQLQNKLRIDLLYHLTFHDQLTGAYNRHFLASEVPKSLKQVVREKDFISVIMLDIDHFKGFNDTYGHLAGDGCLRDVAVAIQKEIKRPIDRAIRYGGEEFCVILPNTDSEGCQYIAENIVNSVSRLGINNVTSPLGVVTISAGYFTTRPTVKTSIDNLIQTADLFLFEAKEAGKNQAKGENYLLAL